MKTKTTNEDLLFRMIHDYLLVYLPKQRCSSPHTIESCKTALNQMIDYMVMNANMPLKVISFDNINREMMLSFLDNLTESRNVSASTRNQRLACIRGFVKYAAARNPELISILLDLSTVPLQQDETNTGVEYLSMEAMQTLLDQPDLSKEKGVRDQFFMILMYDTAARLQEMLDIRICDIHTGSTPTVTVTGKGSKTRTIPLMKKTVDHFERYMKIFHPRECRHSTKPLFYVTRKGNAEKISGDAVRRFLNKYAMMAHAINDEVPEHIHPHLFRHSRAMHLYQNGMELALISQWLGHTSIQSTLIYAHADTEQKRRAIEKANGNLLLNSLSFGKEAADETYSIKKMCGLI